jgi:hypothetical protein
MHHGSGDSGRTAGRALTGSFCHYQTFTVTAWNDRLWSIPALRLSTSTHKATLRASITSLTPVICSGFRIGRYRPSIPKDAHVVENVPSPERKLLQLIA